MITADTNVFIYSIQSGDLKKRQTANLVLSRLAQSGSVIALQVVGEFQHSARRKLPMNSAERARYGEIMLATFEVFAISRSAVERAIAQSAEGRLSYWDSLLIASAAEAGCHTLLSEDMGDGETYLGVRVLNPFGAGGALSDAAREALGL